MAINHEQVIEKIRAAHNGAVLDVVQFRGEWTAVIEASSIRAVVSFLKSDPQLQFNFLADLTAVDNLPEQAERYEVVYNLASFDNGLRLRLKARIPGADPRIDSVTPVFKGANWFEREVYDMFGIRFEGHPDLRRIVNPETFPGHPLRKDFDGGPRDEYCPVPIRTEQ